MRPNPPVIWLASASPRRCELLTQIGIGFRQVVAPVDESKFTASCAFELVTMLAREKARTTFESLAHDGPEYLPVLGADTVVVLDDRALGKPRDRDDAIAMLNGLSGITHEVITAIALHTRNELLVEAVTTRVTFKNMTANEIDQYCDTDEPWDKAGAYAIQGRAAAFVSHLEGSYSAVVGLPLFETVQLLLRGGVRV